METGACDVGFMGKIQESGGKKKNYPPTGLNREKESVFDPRH